MNELSDRQKHQYMRIAMNIIGFNVNEKAAGILVQLYEEMLNYKGNLNINQIISIQESMEYVYKKEEQ